MKKAIMAAITFIITLLIAKMMPNKWLFFTVLSIGTLMTFLIRNYKYRVPEDEELLGDTVAKAVFNKIDRPDGKIGIHISKKHLSMEISHIHGKEKINFKEPTFTKKYNFTTKNLRMLIFTLTLLLGKITSEKGKYLAMAIDSNEPIIRVELLKSNEKEQIQKTFKKIKEKLPNPAYFNAYELEKNTKEKFVDLILLLIKQVNNEIKIRTGEDSIEKIKEMYGSHK